MNDSAPLADAAGVHRRLAALLARVEANDRLCAELDRARREFFGQDRSDPADGLDPTARAAAAQRFVEWFVIERQSDVLGGTVVDSFGDPDDNDAPLAHSRAGLFLVETGGADPTVRDLDGGEALQLVDASPTLRPGDVLAGRLFPLDDGAYAPSIATGLFAESPGLAVAFQRDGRRLALGRRLSQAELERLVFQQWAAAAGARQGAADDAPPLERIEADLQRLLETAGLDDLHSATSLGAAMKAAIDRPGAVIGPILDELAFQTEADLDAARVLLLQLWNAHRRRATGERTTRSAPFEPPQAPPQFQEQTGEHLGQRLARRIEEGLGNHEDIESLFADVERLLGEPLDDESEPESAGEGIEDGDLAALLREFAWETGLAAAEEQQLDELLRAQQQAPVPRLNVEYLQADDWLRWLCQIWLGAKPARRAEAVRGAFDLATRFCEWLADTQAIDCRDRLVAPRRVLLDAADRLQRAGSSLGDDALPPGGPFGVRLLRVLGRREDAFEVESIDDGNTTWVAAPANALAALEIGDLLFAAVDAAGDSTARLKGPVALLPAGTESLLG
ncbi:MAG: hypothetical protein HZB39_03560 [Planctomycetes bacterium]|nr:hypothetical protein [Planctomycetota bacterium]